MVFRVWCMKFGVFCLVRVHWVDVLLGPLGIPWRLLGDVGGGSLGPLGGKVIGGSPLLWLHRVRVLWLPGVPSLVLAAPGGFLGVPWGVSLWIPWRLLGDLGRGSLGSLAGGEGPWGPRSFGSRGGCFAGSFEGPLEGPWGSWCVPWGPLGEVREGSRLFDCTECASRGVLWGALGGFGGVLGGVLGLLGGGLGDPRSFGCTGCTFHWVP